MTRPAFMNPVRCLYCRFPKRSSVVQTRNYKTHRWRRYECPDCRRRWSTYETRLNIRRIRLDLSS